MLFTLLTYWRSVQRSPKKFGTAIMQSIPAFPASWTFHLPGRYRAFRLFRYSGYSGIFSVKTSILECSRTGYRKHVEWKTIGKLNDTRTSIAAVQDRYPTLPFYRPPPLILIGHFSTFKYDLYFTPLSDRSISMDIIFLNIEWYSEWSTFASQYPCSYPQTFICGKMYRSIPSKAVYVKQYSNWEPQL